MRRLAAAAVLIAVASSLVACRGGRFIRQYEYEEDLYLDLDGSATVVVNASVPALVALRGLDLPIDPRARLDRGRVRAQYESPAAGVARVSRPWRRSGRRFVQVRVDVNDVRRLSDVRPFSWSEYTLGRQEGVDVFRQVVRGTPARGPAIAWTGRERVAFRVHLPSRIRYHNVRDLDTGETSDIERGNILTWEQRLSDRLAARPLEMEVRMDRQSILYHTLWLFAGAFAAAVALLGAIVWWMARRGAKAPA